jgi:hypothetical protein
MILNLHLVSRNDFARRCRRASSTSICSLMMSFEELIGALPPTAQVMFRMEARHRMGGASGQYI